MIIRKVLFWLHLTAGAVAGSVILLMCVTGAALGFEKQIVRWAERKQRYVASNRGAQRLPMETLLAQAWPRESGQPLTVTWRSETNSAVELGLEKGRTVFLSPYTGEKVGEGALELRAFFAGVEGYHRWLGANRSARPTAGSLTAGANLLFLFLACSGLYLWLPRNWTWNAIKTGMTFRRGLPGRARGFNWHNAIGFWMC